MKDFIDGKDKFLSICIAGDFLVECVIDGSYAEEIEGLVYHHSLLHQAAKDVHE